MYWGLFSCVFLLRVYQNLGTDLSEKRKTANWVLIGKIPDFCGDASRQFADNYTNNEGVDWNYESAVRLLLVKYFLQFTFIEETEKIIDKLERTDNVNGCDCNCLRYHISKYVLF